MRSNSRRSTRLPTQPTRALRPAVFLDRDGTLIDEVDYLSDPDLVVLLPGVAEGLSALASAGFALVVVTNQSGIARGKVTPPELRAIHARLEELLATRGAHVDRIESCPHHPVHGSPPYRRVCSCRKPAPGMLFEAARALDIDLAQSWIIGDAGRDLDAGLRAGLCGGILLGTGKGTRERERLATTGAAPTHFAPDFADAVKIILSARARVESDARVTGQR